MPLTTIAALQIGRSPQGTTQPLTDVQGREAEIRARGARLVVMPEALPGGYARQDTFQLQVDRRSRATVQFGD